MALKFKLPDIGEGIAEGEIVQWLVKAGDTVAEDQPLVEVMTDKVTAEIPSPVSGVIKETFGAAGEVIKVGAVIAVIETADAAPAAKETKQTVEAAAPALTNGSSKATPPRPAIAPQRTGGKVLAAPATRKLARELGVDLALISGSGPRGRVTPDDVRSFSGGDSTVPQPLSRPITGEETEKRVPFIGMRRKIAEHLVKSKQTAPHFAYVEEVDMSELVSMREQLKEDAQARGVKLTYLPFIIKAVIAALREYPVLNSTLDEAKGELVYKNYYHMGIATATEQGLIVPVLKHAEYKNLFQLALEIQDLSQRARDGKLKPDEVTGGTFTLTSIGSIGGLFGVPIINYPEVAIMGINKITPRPVVRDGQIVIRDIMNLSLSCDHRVVDGAEGALFTKKVIEYLEKPARLLLDV